mmetsp:Transcript_25695/g.39067  ORF Transcript_25695/g.39067 Transcript_25695/m.39067 type:complete len:248 (-) Transcript_25695:38-781(-)
MGCIVVHEDLELDARALQGLLQSCRGLRIREALEGVLLAEVALHGDLDGGAVEVGLVGDSVEGGDASDLSAVLHRRGKGERSAHAKACDSARLAALTIQEGGCGLDFLDGPREVQMTHQVRGLLGIDAELALVEVRYEAAVTLGGDLLGLGLDLLGDAPPLLQDHDAWSSLAAADIGRELLAGHGDREVLHALDGLGSAGGLGSLLAAHGSAHLEAESLGLLEAGHDRPGGDPHQAVHGCGELREEK